MCNKSALCFGGMGIFLSLFGKKEDDEAAAEEAKKKEAEAAAEEAKKNEVKEEPPAPPTGELTSIKPPEEHEGAYTADELDKMFEELDIFEDEAESVPLVSETATDTTTTDSKPAGLLGALPGPLGSMASAIPMGEGTALGAGAAAVGKLGGQVSELLEDTPMGDFINKEKESLNKGKAFLMGKFGFGGAPAEADKGDGRADKKPAGGDKKPAGTDKAAGEADKKPAVDKAAAGADKKPSEGDKAADGADKKPAAVDKAPAEADKKPVEADKK